MLVKVVSGGQAGVDQAALAAAQLVGLQTGGWLPAGCRTLAGPRRDMLTKYGMQECTSANYAVRTGMNVRDSAATIRLAVDFNSPGERCTLEAIRQHKRARLDIRHPFKLTVDEFLLWVNNNYVHILNVAGNSEQTAPGIFADAFEFLVPLFRAAKADTRYTK